MSQLKIKVEFTISKEEFIKRFDECIDEVKKDSDSIITENGKPIARLTAYEEVQ